MKRKIEQVKRLTEELRTEKYQQDKNGIAKSINIILDNLCSEVGVEMEDGFYYLKDGDLVKNGDECCENEDGGWWITLDNVTGETFYDEKTMYVTRRKL